MRTYYTRYSAQGVRHGICAGCGKTARRLKAFGNTVNPFNTNEDGSVRTALEVQAHVRSLAAEWSKAPAMHARCEVATP